MGQVYQATDTKLNRQVALKILPEAFATGPDRLARFRREVQLLASLNHPRRDLTAINKRRYEATMSLRERLIRAGNPCRGV